MVPQSAWRSQPRHRGRPTRRADTTRSRAGGVPTMSLGRYDDALSTANAFAVCRGRPATMSPTGPSRRHDHDATREDIELSVATASRPSGLPPVTRPHRIRLEVSVTSSHLHSRARAPRRPDRSGAPLRRPRACAGSQDPTAVNLLWTQGCARHEPRSSWPKPLRGRDDPCASVAGEPGSTHAA